MGARAAPCADAGSAKAAAHGVESNIPKGTLFNKTLVIDSMLSDMEAILSDSASIISDLGAIISEMDVAPLGETVTKTGGSMAEMAEPPNRRYCSEHGLFL
ncbi:MAG: hypothetical protein WAV18_14980 [Roseiarcus sp.]